MSAAKSIHAIAAIVDRNTSDIQEILESLREVNRALTQVVALTANMESHKSAVGRAHSRIDEHDKILNGEHGLSSRVATLQEAIRESIWFRRIITAAIITQSAALLYLSGATRGGIDGL